MNSKVLQIKELVKKECKELGFSTDWFYDHHLLAVEKFAKQLLARLPEANTEAVMLSVWLHDIQRIRGLDGDHAEVGGTEAAKILKEFGYDSATIDSVKSSIQSHRCDKDNLPTTLEGKMLASADAMAHFSNDFYIRIATTGKYSPDNFKEWATKKIERDFHGKISFDFARESVRERYEAIKRFLTLED